MDKKLPKVFANKIDKSVDNNKKYYYSANSDMPESENSDSAERSIPNDTEDVGMNIHQKINSIFSSPRYVYKADVVITTKDGTTSKRIIGKNGVHLITIDNELIPISDILDIKFKD